MKPITLKQNTEAIKLEDVDKEASNDPTALAALCCPYFIIHSVDDDFCCSFLATGFLTAKGSLVRSIMYPPPVDYRFERDSYKFVAVLAFIAFCGFGYSIFLKVNVLCIEENKTYPCPPM